MKRGNKEQWKAGKATSTNTPMERIIQNGVKRVLIHNVCYKKCKIERPKEQQQWETKISISIMAEKIEKHGVNEKTSEPFQLRSLLKLDKNINTPIIFDELVMVYNDRKNGKCLTW